MGYKINAILSYKLARLDRPVDGPFGGTGPAGIGQNAPTQWVSLPLADQQSEGIQNCTPIVCQMGPPTAGTMALAEGKF